MAQHVATITDLDMALPVAAFRHDFINLFNDFAVEVNVLAAGHAQYNNSWKDDFGVQGISVSTAMVDGLVAILAAAGVLSAAASAAITIPVSMIGILAAFAYQKWRDDKKDKEFVRAERKLERSDLMADIEKIADGLVELYQMQLESCTVKDAVKMAEATFKAISSDILKNENLDFNELFHPATLQGVMLRSESRMPNIKLNMNTKDTLYYSTREMVTKPALYCRETKKFYENAESDPKKYGVLFFDKKNELDDYVRIASKVKDANPKWEYKDMVGSEVSLLRDRSLFRRYREGEMFGVPVIPAKAGI